jgi:hypothetical protein
MVPAMTCKEKPLLTTHDPQSMGPIVTVAPAQTSSLKLGPSQSSRGAYLFVPTARRSSGTTRPIILAIWQPNTPTMTDARETDA